MYETIIKIKHNVGTNQTWWVDVLGDMYDCDLIGSPIITTRKIE